MELFPEDRDQLVDAASRAARLSRACGCTEGAIAMTIGIALAAVYYLWARRHAGAGAGVRVSGLWALPFVIAVSGVGKLIGIGIARLRLAAIYRRIYARYDPEARRV